MLTYLQATRSVQKLALIRGTVKKLHSERNIEAFGIRGNSANQQTNGLKIYDEESWLFNLKMVQTHRVEEPRVWKEQMNIKHNP